MPAIHQGDVDAVVVMRSLEGPQVILLHGAEEPYRVLVERMSDGALTAGPDGVILYVNDRLCELTGYPSSRLVGRDLASLFEGEPPTLVPEVTAEASLLRNHNNAMPVAVWSRPISIGDTSATLVRLTDLSIHRRAEQIATAERFARSVLEQATEAVVVLAPDGHITHASWRGRATRATAAGRLQFSEAFPLEAQSTDRGGNAGAIFRREPRHHAGDQAVSRRRSEAARRTATPNRPSCSAPGRLSTTTRPTSARSSR